MPDRLLSQRLLALAAAGVVLFDFPLLALWEGRALPLFGLWAGFIGLVAWLMERGDREG